MQIKKVNYTVSLYESNLDDDILSFELLLLNKEYERTDFVNLAEDNNPEDLFLDKEEHAEKIELIKSKLSDFEIEVLNHYLSGEKQSEIAKALGKNAKSIDNTIQRIKNKVK